MTLAIYIFVPLVILGITYAVVHGLTVRGPFIQHHFDDDVHQFDSGKLGIWLFLGQEVLFFSALFVAYIIYRHNHPEVFAYAHQYLDVKMGAINTGVLILSSLTAAWAVRAAQLGQKKLLIGLIIVTLLCAFGFLVIKYFEYEHKAHVGTVFGKRFVPHEAPDGRPIHQPDATPGKTEGGAPAPKEPVNTVGGTKAQPAPGAAPGTPAPGTQPVVPEDPSALRGEPASTATGVGVLPALEAQKRAGVKIDTHASALPPPNTGMFFTIYFAMTGLHGIHVLAGIFVFIWLLIRACRGHFGPRYYGPVDFAALYWHLVDLIWIFLFPLLYLIH
ncbi:MAG TPA: cytochrome c oxidase subunit 3 [Kofleriaceae bacterium]|nr:cytochrome c oxidase subunit 3 [Kofleriaceae bacterium]